MKRMGWLVFLPLAAAGCAGEGVALNERVFDATTLELKAAGCSRYQLGSGSHSASSGGSVSASLAVNQRDDGDRIRVSVAENGMAIVERVYPEAFFMDRQADEFTATSRSGAESLLLRFWGAPDGNGASGCTPLSDSGPANR